MEEDYITHVQFEPGKHMLQFQCEYAVYAKDTNSSLCSRYKFSSMFIGYTNWVKRQDSLTSDRVSTILLDQKNESERLL